MAHLIETALDKAQTSWQIYIIYLSPSLSRMSSHQLQLLLLLPLERVSFQIVARAWEMATAFSKLN